MISLGLLAIVGQSGASWDREAVLSSMENGKPLGRVEVFLKLLPGGSVRRKTICSFFLPSGKSYITDEEEWDALGVMKSAVRRSRTGEESGQTVASFTPTGAVLKFSSGQGAKGDEEVFDLPEGWRRGESCLAWLTGGKPTAGESSKGVRFDFDRLGWTEVTTVYKGKEATLLRGQRIEAHVFEDSLGVTLHADDKGLPIRQTAKDEAGTVVWERISSVVHR